MVYSVNDKIRNIISTAKTLSEVVIYLEQINPNFKEQIIKLAISDFYKLNYIMTPHNQIDNNVLKNINFEKIYEQSEDNYRLLGLMLNSLVMFNKLDTISKIIIFEELEDDKENEKLNKFNKLHLFDKIIYKFNYNLDNFKEYYIDCINKNSKMINKTDNVSIYITNRMLDLSQININKYKKIILEMIKEYYIWKKFILDHEGGYLLNPLDFTYLEIIENDKLCDMLKNIKEDYVFLNTIVEEYLHYTTSKLEINRELVSEYYEENTKKEIQKKLEIK